MKRRSFFKKGVQGAVAASIIPLSGCSSNTSGNQKKEGNPEQWQDLGSGKKGNPNRDKELHVDVLIAGGGVAGCCAAVSAARNGAKTILVQDRPVLGGNGSSEIRVHLNGVTHLKNGKAERETGVVEEILLENRFQNPQQSWHVWDHVIYDYVASTPNLKVMLNTQALQANMKGGKIESVDCLQYNTETTFKIYAQQFIDCSGDGLMAATAGALYRTGREGKAEFNEKYAPDEPDGWQMGSTIMFSTKDMGKPMPFEPPHYAIPFDAEKAAENDRKIKQFTQGYWWIEVGSENDIIAEADEIRQRLMGHLYGIWDYIKNSGKHPESENFALDWVASIPGRRESRRFMGDHILIEGDLLSYRHFEDAVGYGGWSLDEHNPGGIENLSDPPSFFHEKFTKVYEIPFGSLYSVNIPNLLFAGRNISVSHIALSSTRLQGTCATMGQAVGTAAAICIKKEISPRELRQNHINELQEQLLRDDAYIPNRPAKDSNDLAKKASMIFASSTSSGDAKLLTNGYSRDVQERDEINHWQSVSLPADVILEWEAPQNISKIEIKCDTNTLKNIMMRHTPGKKEKFIETVPPELTKSLYVEARVNGAWVKVGEVIKNRRRLIKFSFDSVRATAVKVVLTETYGVEVGRLYEVRCYA
ncbi:FAD-dependent oxidoreductase [Flavivirga amylovorans]|uniref:FAD-dependent oxidoreductase n=1 Tax=Flavivirga amylovorans TaxID=870486 RepID=A0ABT8WVZ1_9FLAO|nr:FAD-dependent oxidoreductase [Flavivirga amylovorans]MDO5985835.1 FAD-dependent oxidoreductase [Flavivirga amylovorans]